MGNSYSGSERRKDLRLLKTYTLFFYLKEMPYKKMDSSLIKNISRGGVHFTTSQFIKEGTSLIFEIGIPYIAPEKLKLEGLVISCREITRNLVYDIRSQFVSIDEKTSLLFEKIENRKP